MKPVQGTHASVVPGETLATFRWVPPEYRAAVFLVHGFRSHALYSFLRNDAPGSIHQYGHGEDDTSFVRELNQRGFAVFSHDHVGHGSSTGMRAFFPRFSGLVEDTAAYVNAIDAELALSTRTIPKFVVGHSLGGTISLVLTRDNPAMFKGMVLSSAACEPPTDMFGIKGKILSYFSSLASALVPTMEVMALPKNTHNPPLQVLYESDPLNYQGQLRARVGREFMLAYADISAHLADIKIPFLAASGELDTLVNPEASKRLMDGASSEDKTLFVAVDRWHNNLTEDGKEEIWTLFSDWIDERVK